MDRDSQNAADPQAPEEIAEATLDLLQGGARRSATGPGTQTEDDLYVG